jgi:hypothetical protein
MQPTCSNCRYPLQPGAAVCTNCGTPVSPAGGGSYDPTVRAGVSPGSSYGQPSYGAPSGPDPYSAQYSGPPPAGSYGPPPGGAYGPPPAGSYGAPPAQPGFGSPPPYGAPVAYPGQMPPPQKSSHKGLYIGLGVVGGIVIVAIIGCIVVSNLVINAGKKIVNSAEATLTAAAGELGSATTGAHITTIQVGTGFDQNTGDVIGEKSSFSAGENAWVVYTVETEDTNATVQLKLYNNGTLSGSTDPESVDTGQNKYGNEITNLQSGSHRVEIYYNDTLEAFIIFNVV